METKVEIKNLCPMIAVISAGKTSILKVIFDVDFLEVSAGIGTKFVNIIRYNPNVGKNPKFYHLIIKDKGEGDYEYYKDQNFPEVIGKENIKKKNEEINQELKNKNVPYEELFYMIEVGEVNFIEDKEYLKNYDLVDIPGVSECNEEQDLKERMNKEPTSIDESINLEAAKTIYQGKTIAQFDTIEKEMENYNPLNEKSYLTEIFRIIKNKMNNGIIVFSIDNHRQVENYRIIGKLHKVIGKPIENFLILLNKIDKSENKQNDLDILISKIMKFFPSETFFNFTKNIIVPCSTLQLENESKMDKDFKKFLYFHFINFLMRCKNNTPSAPAPQKTQGDSFIDFLKRVNRNKKIKKKEFLEKITKVIEDKDLPKILSDIKDILLFIKDKHSDDNLNLGVRSDDFEEEEIKNIKENLKVDDDDEGEQNEEEDNFNINDQDEKTIILYFYSEFKNKKQIPPKSKDTKDIINFFTMKYIDKTKNKKKPVLMSEDDKKKINKSKKIDEISSRMLEFYEKYKNENIRPENLKRLKIYINSSLGILKTSKLLYIPTLGVSNAGKSTILNGLIGCSILPAHKNETTKKGILIKHWDKEFPVLRKTKFKNDKMDDQEIYYFESEKEPIAIGLEEIQRTLEGANGEFTNNTEDFFYEIDINIKFVNDMNIDDNLKEKICFIDLPGFGTNNTFEQNKVYTNLMKSCNIFLFIVFNLKIKENENKKMLDNLYSEMVSFRGVTSQAFVEKCLFIINFDRDQDISKKSEIQAKNDIISVIKGLDEKSENKLNVCFFNAKYYENYIFKLRYYKSPSDLIRHEYNEFLKLQEDLWKGFIEKIKGGTFNKYLTDKLKDNIKNDIPDKFNESSIEPNEEIVNSIKEIIKFNNLNFKEKEINLISKYITLGNENISKSDLLNKSNIEIFSKDLLVSIGIAKKKEDIEINNNINNCLKILDDVFQVDPNTKFGKCKDAPIAKIVKPHVEEDLNNMTNEVDRLINLINDEFTKNNIVSILDSCIGNISNTLNNKKRNIEINLEKNDKKSVQKDFEDAFKIDAESLKSKLISTLQTSSKNINTYYNQCYDKLDEFYSDSCKRQNILFENHISNSLGGNNNIEQSIQELIDDIINNSKDAADWDKVDGFWNWLYGKISSSNYLNKIIDSIINDSTVKLKNLRDNIEEYVNSFKAQINNEILSSKDRVVIELNEKREEEELEIKLTNSKNEEERKKWEEEKRIIKEKKIKWEQLCRKYRVLRDEITGLRLGSD